MDCDRRPLCSTLELASGKPPADLIATQSLTVGKWTLAASVLTIIIASVAAYFTYEALKETQRQIAIVLRAPRIAMGILNASRVALGCAISMASTAQITSSKCYDFEVAAAGSISAFPSAFSTTFQT